MKYKNSFFVIEIRDDGTYMHLYPAVSGGKTLGFDEIAKFLKHHMFMDYSRDTIKDALAGLQTEKTCIKISSEKMQPFDERVVITAKLDGTIATARFYPPSNGGKLLTKEDIYDELKKEKVVFGIQEKVIDVFLLARQYCLDIPIAKALLPIPAKDTKITYHFDTKPLAKPKLLPDGGVDFHELNLFCPVKKGELLATLESHTMGEPGRSIFGKVIQQNRPKITFLKFGKKISVNDEKTEIRSEVDGNVSLVGDTVFVSDVYKVAADVDASTGDIDYDGNIEIPGMVKTGFTVKAKGDIIVNGGVEGATLIAGGNIVIRRGVQGMGKGHLTAGGDIAGLFFESANVTAGGDVISGPIMHSHVTAGGKIVSSGKKGFIVGGEVCCKQYIDALSIGNKMETQTILKVGVDEQLRADMKKAVNRMTEINKEIEEITPVIQDLIEKQKKKVKLPPDKLKYFAEEKVRYTNLLNEKEELNAQLVELKELINRSVNGFIRVFGAAHRGTTLFISKYAYSIKDKQTHVVFKVDGVEIRPMLF